jgi:hypothetical protein
MLNGSINVPYTSMARTGLAFSFGIEFLPRESIRRVVDRWNHDFESLALRSRNGSVFNPATDRPKLLVAPWRLLLAISRQADSLWPQEKLQELDAPRIRTNSLGLPGAAPGACADCFLGQGQDGESSQGGSASLRRTRFGEA